MGTGLVWGWGRPVDSREGGGVSTASPSSGVGLSPAVVPCMALGGAGGNRKMTAREGGIGGGQEANSCADHGLECGWGRPEDSGPRGWRYVHRFILRVRVWPQAGNCGAHGLAWGRWGPEDDSLRGWRCVHRSVLCIRVWPQASGCDAHSLAWGQWGPEDDSPQG